MSTLVTGWLSSLFMLSMLSSTMHRNSATFSLGSSCFVGILVGLNAQILYDRLSKMFIFCILLLGQFVRCYSFQRTERYHVNYQLEHDEFGLMVVFLSWKQSDQSILM